MAALCMRTAGEVTSDRTRRACLLAAVCLICGCAERGAPPGGPIDDVPPAVMTAEPADGATRVAPGTPIRLVFSERMNRESVERALRIAPDPGRFERAWSEMELTLRLAGDAPSGPLGERVVTILRTAEDRRRNRLAAPFEIAYTSGDSLPAGSIAGKLTGDSQGQARILLYPSPGPSLDSLAVTPPIRETSAAQSGEFRLESLSTSGAAPLALFAVSQAQRRDRLDPARDRVAVGPDSLVLAAERPRIDDADLSLVRPDAPGSVWGRIEPPRPDAVARLHSLADSSRTLEAPVDSSGAFLLESVPPGGYRLRVVAAADSGSTEEPIPGVPDPLVVAPGRRVMLSKPDSLAAPAPRDSTSIPDRREEER